MRTGLLPPQSRIRPWFGAGEVAVSLPALPPDAMFDRAVQMPEPSSTDPARGVGAVGQPYLEPDAGLPAMSEASLIRAHHAYTCHPQLEHLPWESWSEGQWQWFRRRQRVMAQRTAQRERQAERRKEGAA